MRPKHDGSHLTTHMTAMPAAHAVERALSMLAPAAAATPHPSPLRNTHHWSAVAYAAYLIPCFNVGAHVNEVADSAYAAIVGGLM